MRLVILASALIGLSAPDGRAAADLFTERLSYTIEWRLIHAGNAVVESGPNSALLKLESAGLVSTLYKVDDTYKVQFDSPFCATSSMMDSKEGSRHRETAINFDRSRNRAFLTEKDVIRNTIVSAPKSSSPIGIAARSESRIVVSITRSR